MHASMPAPNALKLSRSIDKPALERPPPRRQKKASVGADPRLLSPRGKARPRRRNLDQWVRRAGNFAGDDERSSTPFRQAVLPPAAPLACLRRPRRSLGGAADWTCVRPSNNTHCTRLGTRSGVTGNQTRWLDKGQFLAFGGPGWAAWEQERTQENMGGKMRPRPVCSQTEQERV